MSDEPERLQKVLAAAGMGSRRVIETWIADGRVAVNERTAVLGQRVAPDDVITIDGRPFYRSAPRTTLPRVIAYNKPEGEICTRRDPEGRPTVFERLPRVRGGRWVSVGRLDINTTGLLLLTDSGELANRLMRPASGIEREYLVRVAGEVDDAMIARLQAGVMLEDGESAFDSVKAQADEGRHNRWFLVSLREGRNREVRRLWESQGVVVSRLKRVRFGCIALGPRDRRGTSRELTDDEVLALCASVGFEPPKPQVKVPAAPAGRISPRRRSRDSDPRPSPDKARGPRGRKAR